MSELATGLLDGSTAVLLAGLAVASFLDLRDREVPDGLWMGLGLAGGVLGGLEVASGGIVPVVVWLIAAGFVLQHLVPWDRMLGDGTRADLLELGLYVAVLVVVGVAVLRWGLGPDGVPVSAVAVVLVVLFARALFEGGVLFGGADAKAVMVAGLLVPFFASPLVAVPASVRPVTEVLPFAVNLLLDAALLSVIAPLTLAVLNARRREFHWRDGFTTYTIPVADLPRRWVWVRDPDVPVDRAEEDEIETSEEDRAWRARIAAELERKGTERVRVGPQLPFIVFLFAGALAAVAFGNLVLDAILAI
jgi:hypothetical protein